MTWEVLSMRTFFGHCAPVSNQGTILTLSFCYHVFNFSISKQCSFGPPPFTTYLTAEAVGTLTNGLSQHFPPGVEFQNAVCCSRTSESICCCISRMRMHMPALLQQLHWVHHPRKHTSDELDSDPISTSSENSSSELSTTHNFLQANLWKKRENRKENTLALT